MRLCWHFILTMLLAATLLGLEVSCINLSPNRDHPGCTVVVRPGRSLQAAIDSAQQGTVICLTNGKWRGNIKVGKSLTLRGLERGRSIIRGKKEGHPVIRITAPEVGVEKVSVKIERLIITDAHGPCSSIGKGICADGILIQGAAQAEVAESIIEENGHNGLALFDSAQVEISDSTIYDNNYAGLQLKESAQANISRSTISGSIWGLWLWDSAQVQISRTTISENNPGVLIIDRARAEISDSHVCENQEYGIWLWDSARAEIRESTIGKNGYGGVWLEGSAEIEATGCDISENKYRGIRLEDSARAEIVDSMVESNGSIERCRNLGICNGVALSGASRATISGTIIRNNTDWGVVAKLAKCGYREDEFTGEAILIETEIYGNGDGEVCLP